MWWSEGSPAGRHPAARVLLVAALAAAIGGCGFRPLYGGRDGTPEALDDFAAIKIAPINDRPGQQLRNDLLDLLTPHGEPARPRYTLKVKLSEATSELAVQRSGLATRANLEVDASYVLGDVASGQPLVTDTATAVASYNILNSAYSTLVAHDFARTRALERIAEDIRLRLGLYFGSKPAMARSPGRVAR